MIEAAMLWNEPNNLSHWNFEVDPNWNIFSDMVNQACDAIRSEAPGIKRVLGGMSPIDPAFLRKLQERCVLSHVNAVAVHGFPLDWNHWQIQEWPSKLDEIRSVTQLPIWVSEVGVSTFGADEVQVFGLQRSAELLIGQADHIHWYSLYDLPRAWPATTRHREAEGSSYYRHFYMGLVREDGTFKPAFREFHRYTPDVGICQWFHFEDHRLDNAVSLLKQLGVTYLRTGVSWADSFRPDADKWFDQLMSKLEPFKVTMTFCYTPEHCGVLPSHTSPPRNTEEFAEFCARITRRYARDDLFAQAGTLLQQRKVFAAIECYDAAARVGFDSADCAGGRWQCWMLLGEFKRAWQESDLIAATGKSDAHRFWDGGPWQGKRIMLRCLHGLGDTIQFIRYAPLLRKMCCHLTVQTHPEMVRLLQGVANVDRVITWSEESEDYSDWDMQMEVTELPRAFRTVASAIPADMPYIAVPDQSKPRLHRHGRLIGLVWESSWWNPARSIPFPLLKPLIDHSRDFFYSFQGTAEGVDSLGEQIQDVQDTAAFMRQMDLIITVDTMTAHLAGALGLPVWILLPEISDWRWMLERTDSPWYPSARLYRQSNQGDWGPVIDQVREALRVKGPALRRV